MAKATITVEDIDSDNASLEIDWHGQYDETSGAHRLAGTISGAVERTISGAVERTGPVFDINPEVDGSEGGAHD